MLCKLCGTVYEAASMKLTGPNKVKLLGGPSVICGTSRLPLSAEPREELLIMSGISVKVSCMTDSESAKICVCLSICRQWTSFLAGASTAGYVYIYSFYYYFFKTKWVPVAIVCVGISHMLLSSRSFSVFTVVLLAPYVWLQRWHQRPQAQPYYRQLCDFSGTDCTLTAVLVESAFHLQWDGKIILMAGK